jgi:hypothetical protein
MQSIQVHWVHEISKAMNAGRILIDRNLNAHNKTELNCPWSDTMRVKAS